MKRRLYTTLAMAVCVAGCGGTATTTSTSAPRSSSAPATPTCGAFCQNAGPAGGPSPAACPRGDTACPPYPPCPPAGCLDLLTTSAVVDPRGEFTVRIRCQLSSRPCDGAFLVLKPSEQVGPSGNSVPMRDWVAGSDLAVAPGRTASVPIATTPAGRQLVGSAGGYRGVVSVLIHDYGDVGVPEYRTTLLLHR
jgi:hypothetical protein